MFEVVDNVIERSDSQRQELIMVSPVFEEV